MEKAGVSIIICTYNGMNKLKPTLEHINRLRGEFPWELILVDNASTDRTKEYADEILRNSSIPYSILDCPVPGKMNAFWKGLEHASFKYVLDCDDDNHLREDYLINGLSWLEANPQVGALGGCGIPILEGVKPDWFDRYKRSYAIGPQAPGNGKLNKNTYLYGAGSFFRRDALMKLRQKGFKSLLMCRTGELLTSGGDTELCLALELMGLEIWYSDSLSFGHALSRNRLDWNYYLRMKEGGTSSFPLLLAYKFREYPEERAFRKYLSKMYYLAFKGYVKTIIYTILKNDKRNQLAKRVCLTKLKYYNTNYFHTIEAYRQLGNLF